MTAAAAAAAAAVQCILNTHLLKLRPWAETVDIQLIRKVITMDKLLLLFYLGI